MNKRIENFIEQCDGFITTDDGSRADTPVLIGKDIEKFAELIVLECVNAVMDGTKEGDHYAMRIENHFDSGTGGVLHFGVEE